MKIQYHRNGEVTTAVGVPEDTLEGVNEFLVFAMEVADPKYQVDRARSCTKIKAQSMPRGGDEHDPAVGRDVARDKVLMRHYQREANKAQDLEDALIRQANLVAERRRMYQAKADRAAKRVDQRMN